MKDEDFAIALGGRLTGLREKSGLSADAFGKMGGVSRTAQFAYERGERVPDALYLTKVASSLSLSLHWLLTGRNTEDVPGLSEAERAAIDRLRDLPSGVRRTVDDVMLLAWLAADSRRTYHVQDAEDARYSPSAPAAPLQLHEPPPSKRKPKAPDA